MRRPMALLLVALLVTTGGAASCKKSPTEPSSTTQVVAFGDSITFGIGTSSGGNYVSVLSARLSINIVNAGFPGDTTGDALARIERSVLDRQPKIVMVLLGGNDLLQNVPVQQRINNITTIVQRIRGSGAAVILIGLGSGLLDPFDGALAGLATSTSSTYVPGILDGIFGNAALMADSVHPNNAGHAIIADRLEPALRAALQVGQSGSTP
jgi:lysophospholipase L1-like esterase